MAVLAATLPLLLAIFPRSRPFHERAVASGAAASAVVSSAILVAEIAQAKAESVTAVRTRTYALTDVFSNEAEQQGSVLPVVSAATIAISGLITFGTEVNPYVAAVLAFFQAASWVLGSRKAAAAKAESDAALEVEAVTMTSPMQPLMRRIWDLWPV
mmetsp:Transcript_123779/g.276234  ORF Transcript_123779/g.276234 Transcript_123779/m.276234 type:complete len:157 (+) Transcript_123779:55-525(+)